MSPNDTARCASALAGFAAAVCCSIAMLAAGLVALAALGGAA